MKTTFGEKIMNTFMQMGSDKRGAWLRVMRIARLARKEDIAVEINSLHGGEFVSIRLKSGCSEKFREILKQQSKPVELDISIMAKNEENI